MGRNLIRTYNLMWIHVLRVMESLALDYTYVAEYQVDPTSICARDVARSIHV